MSTLHPTTCRAAGAGLVRASALQGLAAAANLRRAAIGGRAVKRSSALPRSSGMSAISPI